MDNNGSNAAIRGKVHFIGIGGCSMNGLAQILRGRGFEVQGSDSTTSPFSSDMIRKTLKAAALLYIQPQ